MRKAFLVVLVELQAFTNFTFQQGKRKKRRVSLVLWTACYTAEGSNITLRLMERGVYVEV